MTKEHDNLQKLRTLCQRVQTWIGRNDDGLPGFQRDLHEAKVVLIDIEHAIEYCVDDTLHTFSLYYYRKWNAWYKLYDPLP
jgi:hypothetical protein